MNQGEDLFGITYEKNDVIFREGDMGDNIVGDNWNHPKKDNLSIPI